MRTKAAKRRRLETPEPCIYCGGRSRGRATGRVYKTKLGAAHFACVTRAKRFRPHEKREALQKRINELRARHDPSTTPTP